MFLYLLVLIKVVLCTRVVVLIVHTQCLSLSTCSLWPKVICFLNRIDKYLKPQTRCSAPYSHPEKLSFSANARELSAGSDSLRVEPTIGPCPPILGPKEAGVDLKYPGVYWIAGLFSSQKCANHRLSPAAMPHQAECYS